MPILTAPLLCFSVLGKKGKTTTFDRVNSQNIVKQYSVPTGELTDAQKRARGLFSLCAAVWMQTHAFLRTVWAVRYAETRSGDMQQFIGQNLRALAGQTNLEGFVSSPGAFAPYSPFDLVLTPGAGSITVSYNMPPISLPMKWSTGQMLVLKDQDPIDPFVGGHQFFQDRRFPFARTFTGLKPGQPYVVSVMGMARKIGVERFYSISIAGKATPL